MRKVDTNIDEKVNEVIKMFRKRFPKNRNFLIDITLWDDTDFRIELKSSWGGKKDIFSYSKSSNKFEYSKCHEKNGIRGILFKEDLK